MSVKFTKNSEAKHFYNTKGFATEDKQDTINTNLQDIETDLEDISSNVKAVKENQTLAGAMALIVYGANNGTNIDMENYKHLVIKVRATATTGLSPLNNLKLYYSLEGYDLTLSQETIQLYEVPTLTGNYQNTIRIENVGFRYIQFYAHAVQGSPTHYYINYCRYN